MHAWPSSTLVELEAGSLSTVSGSNAAHRVIAWTTPDGVSTIEQIAREESTSSLSKNE